MPLASTQRPISFANYLSNMLLFGLILLTAQGHTQTPESTSTQNDTEQINAEAASSSSEAPPYESRTIRDKILIAKVLPDESQWLDTEYGKILALYRITEARTTLGVLVLLHAAEDPQHWPAALENLRTNLPRYGWETLALALPQKMPAAIPTRPSSSSSSQGNNSNNEQPDTESDAEAITPDINTTPSSSSSSSQPRIERELLIAAYIDAAFKYLAEKNQFNVIVLTDNSSALQSLSKLLPMVNNNQNDRDTIDGPLQALIITNLQQQEPITKAELESIFSVQQLPVMDIFFAPSTKAQQTARELHRAVAMRKKLDTYQQLQLNDQPTITETDAQSFLLGRVRGFMQKKASGVELKNNDKANSAQQESATN